MLIRSILRWKNCTRAEALVQFFPGKNRTNQHSSKTCFTTGVGRKKLYFIHSLKNMIIVEIIISEARWPLVIISCWRGLSILTRSYRCDWVLIFSTQSISPKIRPIAHPLVWDIGCVFGECRAAIISICPMGILNSLAPGRFQLNFRWVIFKLILVNGGWGISYEIALRWMPMDLTDDKSTLVQVMAWCRQATSHYLSQCWPRSLSPNGVTRSQWVNIPSWEFFCIQQYKPAINNFKRFSYPCNGILH